MNKPLLGLLLGGILGVFDGLTSLLSAADDPQVQAGILGIVIGSTLKGVLVGVVTGFVSRRYNSLPIGIGCGLVLGLFLAFLVAWMQGKYYLEIMLPGGTVGVIVGYATQRFGTRSPATRERPAG